MENRFLLDNDSSNLSHGPTENLEQDLAETITGLEIGRVNVGLW